MNYQTRTLTVFNVFTEIEDKCDNFFKSDSFD